MNNQDLIKLKEELFKKSSIYTNWLNEFETTCSKKPSLKPLIDKIPALQELIDLSNLIIPHENDESLRNEFILNLEAWESLLLMLKQAGR